MTKDEAIALSNTKWWDDLDYHDVVKFQLFQPKLCMPFGIFHEALEKALGRPVWTHELGTSNIDNIHKEFLGEENPPSMEDILSLIPEEKLKRIIITGPKNDRPHD